VHLFTLATMVFCFAADCKHNSRKDKCRFFSVSKSFKGLQEAGTLKQVELTH